jgi:predicted regulator of Ras-like GTPase activity (Roadblock/LC7/MglB family)
MSRDGHTLASVLGDTVNSIRLGAMCATLLSLGEKASLELNRGKLRQILIHGEEGYVLLLRIGEKAVLAVVSQPGANLGMLLVEARRTAAEIAALGVV